MKEEYNSSYDSVILQARAMAFANTSMYYVAKKEAGLTGHKLFRQIF
jgi:hypothetical protein